LLFQLGECQLSRLFFVFVIAFGAFGLTACDGHGATITCRPTDLGNRINVVIQDASEGIVKIDIGPNTSPDVTVTIPNFTSGTKDPITVVATKPTGVTGTRFVDLIPTNTGLGQKTDCDPALLTVPRGIRHRATAEGIPGNEHVVDVTNLSPGLSAVAIRVNDSATFHVDMRGVHSNRIDVGSAMTTDQPNTLVFTGRGPRDSSASIMIWDGQTEPRAATSPVQFVEKLLP
jgi:hypothetical protein